MQVWQARGRLETLDSLETTKKDGMTMERLSQKSQLDALAWTTSPEQKSCWVLLVTLFLRISWQICVGEVREAV